MDARDVIDRLALEPHPEGGWYRETWRAEAPDGKRPAGTAIYYLLEAGQRSHWHRVDSAEIWHFHAGAALRLSVAASRLIRPETWLLGADLAAGALPQRVVPPGHWQSAETTGAWTLVGCTVSPGFLFEHFEMAPPGWSPGAG